MSFQRSYNIIFTLWTLDERYFDFTLLTILILLKVFINFHQTLIEYGVDVSDSCTSISE